MIPIVKLQVLTKSTAHNAIMAILMMLFKESVLLAILIVRHGKMESVKLARKVTILTQI